jgi:hypothetical protein
LTGRFALTATQHQNKHRHYQGKADHAPEYSRSAVE